MICSTLLALLISQFSLADSLYEHKCFDIARVEYQREFFFNPQFVNDPYKRLHYAVTLVRSEGPQGIAELHSVRSDFPDINADIRITLAKTYMSIGDYFDAHEILAPTQETELRAFALLLDERYLSACNLLLSRGNSQAAQDILNYTRQPHKSLATATLLSLLCPGAGEVYAGNAPLGIKNFLLNLSSGYLFYRAFRHKKYVDALLIFNLLSQRLYRGSVYNAQKTVIATNERDRHNWLEYMKNRYFQTIEIDY